MNLCSWFWKYHIHKIYDHQIWQAGTFRGVNSLETYEASNVDVVRLRWRDFERKNHNPFSIRFKIWELFIWEAGQDKKRYGKIFVPFLYGEFFNWDGKPDMMGWFMTCLSEHGLRKWFHNFSCWWKLLIKLLFQIQYSSLSQVFKF